MSLVMYVTCHMCDSYLFSSKVVYAKDSKPSCHYIIITHSDIRLHSLMFFLVEQKRLN